MRIKKRITQEQFTRIACIARNHPELTCEDPEKEFGWAYYYPRKKHMIPSEILAHNEVSRILSQTIEGFRSFMNFKHRLNKKGELVVRFDYNYNYDGGPYFSGVGYVELIELQKGFK